MTAKPSNRLVCALNGLSGRAKSESDTAKLDLLGIDALELIKPEYPELAKVANELMAMPCGLQPRWLVQPEASRGLSPVEQIASNDAGQLQFRLTIVRTSFSM